MEFKPFQVVTIGIRVKKFSTIETAVEALVRAGCEVTSVYLPSQIELVKVGG